MSDLGVIILCGTLLLMFLVAHRSIASLNRQRFQAVTNFLEFMKSVYPFRDDRNSEDPDRVERELTALEAYKESKRIRLIVDDATIQDVSLAEWENLAIMNGVSTDVPVEFRFYIQKKPPEGEGENIMNFPSN